MSLDLAATLFAAEASGLADWAVTTSADYAKVRQQFGRPIGQFQGVKHKAARMLALAEQARVCAWDAAACPDARQRRRLPTEASLAAAVAGATALDAGFSVTADCIQVLGGIGYTWEHDAHLYLRRAQSLRILLGLHRVLAAARRRADPCRRPPRAQHRPAARRPRRSAPTFAPNSLPPLELEGAAQKTYLAEKGYTAPHLTAPWGKGADAVASS